MTKTITRFTVLMVGREGLNKYLMFVAFSSLPINMVCVYMRVCACTCMYTHAHAHKLVTQS